MPRFMLATAMGLLFVSTGSGLTAGSRTKFKAVTMEWKGAFCQVPSASYRIVHTTEEWTKLWEEIGKPAPAADLKLNFAVAVFAGTRNTGGYNVIFEKPAASSSKFTVRYRITTPPKGGMVIQALTQPFAVRLYPKMEKSIAVEALNP